MIARSTPTNQPSPKGASRRLLALLTCLALSAGTCGVDCFDSDCSATLRVSVVDQSGAPVTNATTTLDDACCKTFNEGDRQQPCVKETGTSGEAVFHVGGEMSCSIEVDAAGYAPQTSTVSAECPRTQNVDITLTKP